MKRRQKYIILLCCVLLCSLLITAAAVPISASSVFIRDTIRFDREYPDDVSRFRVGPAVSVGNELGYFGVFETAKFDFWPTATSSGTFYEGENLFFGFDYDWYNNASAGVFSYYVGDIFDSSDDVDYIDYADYTTLVIGSGAMYLNSQDLDLKLVGFRFSVRQFFSDGSVGPVVAATPTVLYEADFGVDSFQTLKWSDLTFGMVRDDIVSPGSDLAFCIDFVGGSTNHSTSNFVAFRHLYTSFNFKYYDGPSPDIPQYVLPDNTVVVDEKNFEEQLNNNAQDLTTQFNDMGDNFWRNLEGLSRGMSHINVVLNDLRTDIPFLDFLIQASLYLGLVTFILGCTNLISKITRK